MQYDWTLTWELGAPAGVSRYMILNNGQMPGPTMMLNEGDDVEVSKINMTVRAVVRIHTDGELLGHRP